MSPEAAALAGDRPATRSWTAPDAHVGHADGVDGRDHWDDLDEAWKLAFAMAWEAVGTGNIGVGAAATDEQGAVVAVGRNRVAEAEAPAGELAGSSLAHAEMNVLARLPFRRPRTLVLTTTLQPCLQCAAAIRLGPISLVRIAGPDPLWDGCDDFTGLSPWAGRRGPVPSEGPRRDEVGAFATLLARVGPGLVPPVEVALRELGEGPVLDLARRVEADGTMARLHPGTVDEAFVHLWPALQEAAAAWQGG